MITISDHVRSKKKEQDHPHETRKQKQVLERWRTEQEGTTALLIGEGVVGTAAGRFGWRAKGARDIRMRPGQGVVDFNGTVG